MNELELLQKKLDRERNSRRQAEQLLEHKSHELYELNKDLTIATSSLEEQVKERTKHLDAALAEARQSNIIKRQFLTNISHELKTPLNGVMGILQLLSERPQDSGQKKLLDEAVICAERLRLLIGDMLDLSRLESGSIQLEQNEFDFSLLAKEVLDSYRELANNKGLKLCLSGLSEHKINIVADRGRLRQVLSILVENGIKFTTRGKVRLHICCKNITEHSLILLISVIDTGVGIEEENLGEVFKTFTQVDSSSSRAQQGAGLGLPTVTELLGIMGGNLKVDSQPGLGSTFTVRLPVTHNLKKLPSNHNPHFILVAPYDGERKLVEKDLRSLDTDVTICNDTQHLLEALPGAPSHAIVLFDERIVTKDYPKLTAALPVHVAQRSLIIGLSKQSNIKWANIIGASALLEQPLDLKELKPYLSFVFNQNANAEVIPEEPIVENNQPVSEETPIELKAVPTKQEWSGKLLLVEDNRVNALVVQEMLRMLDVKLDWVTDGKQAIDALLKDTYAFVLMDCQMPVMDGYEATKRIRAGEAGKLMTNIPIVALTADNEEEGLAGFLRKGMNGWIPKPLKRENLVSELERYLRPNEQSNVDRLGEHVWSNKPLFKVMLKEWLSDLHIFSDQLQKGSNTLDLNQADCPLFYLVELMSVLGDQVNLNKLQSIIISQRPYNEANILFEEVLSNAINTLTTQLNELSESNIVAG